MYLSHTQPMPLFSYLRKLKLNNALILSLIFWHIFIIPLTAVANTESITHGINHVHSQKSNGIKGLHDSLGAGVCALDVNNDGWMDLFFVGGQGQHREYGKQSWWSAKAGHTLYINNQNGTFSNQSEFLDAPKGNFIGCHSVDIDGDKDTDLVISGFKQSLLLINNNDSHFSTQVLDGNYSWTTGISIADFDNNGLPDIYLTGYLKYDHSANILEKQSGFNSGVKPQFMASNYPGDRNYLYLNQGATDDTKGKRINFQEMAYEFQAMENDTRSLYAGVMDANGDNYPDIIINNDQGSLSSLLINQQGQKFSPQTIQFPVPKNSYSTTILSLEKGDSGFWFNSRNGQLGSLLKPYEGVYKDRIWRSVSQHNLLSNLNNLSSVEVDINLDGELDLILATGFLTADADANGRSIGQENQVLLQENSQYTKQIKSPQKSSSRSVIRLDIDNDGDMDIVFSNNNAEPELYITKNAPKHWIGLQITHAHFNARRITVQTTQRKIVRHIQNNSLFASHDPRFSFILREDEQVQHLNIDYFNGQNPSYIHNPTANQYIDQHGKPLPAKEMTAIEKISFLSAHWGLMLYQFDSFRIQRSFLHWSTKQQLAFLKDIQQYDLKQQLLGVILIATEVEQTEVVIAAINILKDWENELSFPKLNQLLLHNNQDIRCQAGDAFKHFYIEEEAMQTSKFLAMSTMLHYMAQHGPDICFINALSHTRRFPPVPAINQILKQTKNKKIRHASIKALGELRHTSSLEFITPFLHNNSPETAQLTNIAHNRIKGIINARYFTNKPKEPQSCQLHQQGLTEKTYENCTPNELMSFIQHRMTSKQKLESLLYSNLKNPSETALLFKKYYGSKAIDRIFITLNNNASLNMQLNSLLLLRFFELKTPQVTIVKRIFSSHESEIQLRIAAGNILIKYEAETVLDKAEELSRG